MFRRKYFIITVKGGKSQYSANKKKKCVSSRLKYNEVVWGVKILQVKQRYSRNRLSSLGLHRGQVLPPPKDLSYSVKHCCSECCFSEHWPFRWHGQPAVQWPWKQMCLNEQDTDMREGAMFLRAFYQLLRVLHDTMPSSDKKSVGMKKNIPNPLFLSIW